jgi:beta-lactamase class A
MTSLRKWPVAASFIAAAACVAAPVRPPADTARATPAAPRQQLRLELPEPASPPPTALAQSIRSIWANFPGRTGIAVLSDNGDWLIEHRGEELMPQQSVSKLWVAIAAMDAIDKGRLRLEDRVVLRKSDIAVFHSPISRQIGDNGFETSVADLLKRSMTQSDNTANDFLLRKVGGSQAVRQMIVDKGLGAIRFGPGERLLQAGTAGLEWKPEYSFGRAFQAARAQLPAETRRKAMDRYIASPPDGAAPLAIARALLRLKRGELLSRRSTAHLLGLMESSETGRARLKGGMPPGWVIAHKTGTGQDLNGRTAGFNDVGIMTAPDGSFYAVAVMIADTTRPIPERQMVMQSVAANIASNHRMEPFAVGR